MKKIFLIGTAALGMFFMTTSCLDNTEPAGIEAMRTAKSELIRAQAEYQQALAAYQQAQIAITEAEAAALLLENQMKELELQQKQLELDLQEAKNEHEIRMMELEYLLAQEQNNADIAELQMQIAELELRQLQLELDMLDLENQRELMIQQHELALLNLQATLAETQAYYEETLRNLEAARHGLTEGEQNKLDQYIRQIEAIQAKIDVAENELIAAQNEVVELKFSYNTDSLRLYNQYTFNVKIAQRALDEANADLEEVRSLDLTGGAESLIAEKTAFEEQIEDLEGQIDDLTLQADEKEYEKEAPEAEIRKIEAQINDVNNQINELYDQVNETALNDDEVRELEVPETIARFVGNIVANNDWENSGYITILEGFEDPDYTLGQLHYTLPGGVFSWRATGNTNRNTVLPQLISELKSYVFTQPGLLNMQNSLTSFKQDYNAVGGVKDRYENNVKVYRKAVAEYEKYAEIYGVLNYTHYTTDNLFGKADDAFRALETMYNEGIPFDGTAVQQQVTGYLDDIRYEQQIRDSLFGNAYTGWEDITYANLTSAADAENHIDYSFIVDAYYNSYTEYYNSTSQNDKRYAYSPSFSADTADWSILEKWYNTSMYLYSLDFSEVELTLDYVGYGEYFVFDFVPEDFPKIRYNYRSTGDDNERSKLLNDLGYTDLSELVYSGFVQNYLWQFLIESAEDFIAYNGDFDGVIADLEAMKAELDAAVDGENDNVKAINEQIYALTQQLADFNEQIRGQYAVIDSIDVEIQKLVGPTNSEKSVLEGKIFRIENTIRVLEGIITGVEIEIDGYIYNPLTDGLEEIHTAYIDYLEYQIDQYELNLQEAQDYLDRLLAAEDPFKQALEDAERALANAQEAYEKLLEEFNYYNELLNDFLTNVLGIGNDDNPEA